MNLALFENPCSQITPLPKRKNTFWLRVEEIPIPNNSHFPKLQSQVAYQSDHIKLTCMLLGKRVVAYILRLHPEGKLPGIVYQHWYVLAFYGSNVNALRILYQDQNVRLVSGGHFNAYGFIFLKQGRAPEEAEPAESSTFTSDNSVLRSIVSS